MSREEHNFLGSGGGGETNARVTLRLVRAIPSDRLVMILMSSLVNELSVELQISLGLQDAMRQCDV